MQDVPEDEEEEVVVGIGDVGCAAMRADAALWAAAARAAATAWRMKGRSSGCGLGAGGWGRRGAAVSAFWARLGRAPARREGEWVGVCGGEQFAWAAVGGRGGWAWVFGSV